jgi:sialidase-1
MSFLKPIAAALALTLPALATPSFDEQALFVSGQNGYHTYRIPAVVRTNAGTLLAFCEGRKNSSSDTGDIDLLVRRSTDNGTTWSPQQLVWSDGNNTCGNPAPVIAADGTIHLLSTWNLGSDSESAIVNGTSANTRRVYQISSTDDGLTWSAATEITATTKQANWTWYATGPGAGIRLTRGTQAGRLIVACDHKVAGTGAFGAHVIYSDDHGSTWQIGAIAGATASVRPNENLAVELVEPAAGGGSRIYFNARDHQGPHARADTFSLDGGLTYTPAVFTDAPHFLTPVVQGGLSRFRATDTGDAANRILFSCPNATTRTRLSIWSSTDEAQTWSAPKLVHEGASAYSDMARLNDDRMGLLYEKGSSSPYETITFARFNEAWLDVPPPPAENPGAAFWGFEETPVGQTISTAPDAILDVHPDGHKLHLTATAAFPVVAGAPAFGNGRAISLTGNGGARIFDSASENRFDYGPGDSFTIEVVCRIPNSSTQVGALVAKDLGPTSPSWWLRVEAGKARFLVSDNTRERVFSSTANINTGQWHHIAAVRDATNPAAKELRLYIDGQLSGTLADTTTGSFANGNALWIGRYNSGSRQLTGDIDLVRITPAALAPTAFVTENPTDYQTWSATHNLSGGPGDDDNGDGRTNFFQYAFGLNPNSGSSVSPVSAPNKTAGTFSYTRRKPALTGLTYTYQSSSTLAGWNDFTPTAEISNHGDPVETITVTLPAALLAEPSLFLRVEAKSRSMQSSLFAFDTF